MKNNKTKELSKNTLLFALGSMGTKIITFFLVPLYTFALSTSDYGKLDIISTTVSLLVPLLTLNIQDAVLRFSFEKDSSPSSVLNASFRVLCISSIILGIILAVLDRLSVFSIESKLLLFLWFSYFLSAANNSVQMFLKATDKSNIIVISGICSTLFCCISNIILLLYFKLGINGYIISSVFSSAINLLICLCGSNIFRTIRNCSFDKTLFKRMLIYSTPLILNSIAWWINTGSDKYIITMFYGKSLEGIYAVSGKIPNILNTIQTVFYNAWAISAIKEYDKNDRDNFIGNTYTLYGALSLLACSTLMLFNPLIGKILYKNEFIEAVNYVPALLVGIVFNGLSLFEGCLYTAKKKTKLVSVSTLFGAFINTALNFILIPKFGAQGAAIATMTGYFIVWLIRTILLKSIVKMKYNHFIFNISLFLVFIQCLFAISKYSFVFQIIVLAAIITIQFIVCKPLFTKLLFDHQ